MRVDAPLLDQPDAITVDWLTAALVGAGAAPRDASVTSFEAAPIGTGQVGQNVRFVLRWNGDAGDPPATVVGKFAAADETSRQAGLLTGTYVREVGFYRDLAARCAMRIPDCYVAELDPASGAFVLLMEDVAPAAQGDQIAGCTVDEAALAMEELGRLHAGFWADPSLGSFEWLTSRVQSAPMLAGLYQAAAGGFVEQYHDRLSAGAASTVERFAPQVLDWLATDDDPLTLLHTDYRLDNMLFGTGGGAPRLTVVDWQTPAIGPGPSDAAYFLGGGLSVDDRRTSERDLLDVYRHSLAAGGVELDAEACWDSYRKNAFSGVHMAVVAAVLVGRHDRGDEMFLAMVERHVTQIADLDSFAAISASNG